VIIKGYGIIGNKTQGVQLENGFGIGDITKEPLEEPFAFRFHNGVKVVKNKGNGKSAAIEEGIYKGYEQNTRY
jgi:hypothetical protein